METDATVQVLTICRVCIRFLQSIFTKHIHSKIRQTQVVAIRVPRTRKTALHPAIKHMCIHIYIYIYTYIGYPRKTRVFSQTTALCVIFTYLNRFLGVSGFPGGFICREAFVLVLQGIVFLAQKCDSGLAGPFVVLPQCWNMLVCHDACHTMVPCRSD